MRFGIALPNEQAGRAQSAGFEYIEEDASRLLKPNVPDEIWDTPRELKLPILAAHGLIPETLAVTGPGVDLPALRLHVQRVCERAGRTGVRVLVLSSPAALRVPDGFDPKQAKQQIVDFLRTALPFFARHELMLAAGPNRAEECNVLTTLPEVLQYIWALDHPNFQCLLDIGQVRNSQVTMEQVNDALPWIRHVYVPEDAGEELRPVFEALRRYHYDGAMTVRLAACYTEWEPARATLARMKRWIAD